MLHYHLRHAHVVELLAFNTDAALGPIVLVMDLLVCSVFDLLHCCDSKPRPPGPDADAADADADADAANVGGGDAGGGGGDAGGGGGGDADGGGFAADS